MRPFLPEEPFGPDVQYIAGAMSSSSLSHLLRERIARHARTGRTALLARDDSASYAELGARIDAWASRVQDIPRGDLVGVPASRSADAVARFFGVMQAGGCPCFVEPGLTAEALLPRAHAVGLRRIVLDDESESMARDLEHGGLRVHLARDLLRRLRRSGSAGIIFEPLDRADLAMMQLTSGSTGLPKGALLTHGGHHREDEADRGGSPAARDAAAPYQRRQQPAHRTVSSRGDRRAGRAVPG
ncbi:MAG: acyl--CoA ligase [Acidobacteria bacterium]|nr:acyl--CoA ligase [Acidobacteriota bacterium]